jgi:uncharacterized membrane protein
MIALLPRTEEEVELAVERWFDNLDRRFMAGEISREDYDRRCEQTSTWAESQYERLALRAK